MSDPNEDPSNDGEQLELFPTIVIYAVITLSADYPLWDGKWRVQTPDSNTKFHQWSRSGNNLASGFGKVAGDLEAAWETALENLEAFHKG